MVDCTEHAPKALQATPPISLVSTVEAEEEEEKEQKEEESSLTLLSCCFQHTEKKKMMGWSEDRKPGQTLKER